MISFYLEIGSNHRLQKFLMDEIRHLGYTFVGVRPMNIRASGHNLLCWHKDEIIISDNEQELIDLGASYVSLVDFLLLGKIKRYEEMYPDTIELDNLPTPWNKNCDQ